MAKLRKLFVLSLSFISLSAESFIVQKVKQQTTDGLHEVIGQLIGDSLEIRADNLKHAGTIQQKEIEITKAIIDDDDEHYFMQADKRLLRRLKLKQQQFLDAQRHWRKIQQEHVQFLEQFEKELVDKKNKKKKSKQRTSTNT